MDLGIAPDTVNKGVTRCVPCQTVVCSRTTDKSLQASLYRKGLQLTPPACQHYWLFAMSLKCPLAQQGAVILATDQEAAVG